MVRTAMNSRQPAGKSLTKKSRTKAERPRSCRKFMPYSEGGEPSLCSRKLGHPGVHASDCDISALLDALGREESVDELQVLARAKHPPIRDCECLECVVKLAN